MAVQLSGLRRSRSISAQIDQLGTGKRRRAYDKTPPFSPSPILNSSYSSTFQPLVNKHRATKEHPAADGTRSLAQPRPGWAQTLCVALYLIRFCNSILSAALSRTNSWIRTCPEWGARIPVMPPARSLRLQRLRRALHNLSCASDFGKSVARAMPEFGGFRGIMVDIQERPVDVLEERALLRTLPPRRASEDRLLLLRYEH